MRARVLLGVALVAIVTVGVSIRAQQQTSIDIAGLLGAADQLSLALKGNEALAKVQEALALATKRDDRIGIAMAHRQMGLVYARMGSGSQSTEWYVKALAEFEALKNIQGAAQALRGLVGASVLVGDTGKARDYASRALKLADDTHDDATRAYILAALIQGRTDPERSEAWNTEILAIAERLGDRTLRANALAQRGTREFDAGDYVAARASFERAIADYEATGDIESIAATYLDLGRVFRAHADYEGALQRYQKAIDLLAPTQERYTIVEATNAKAIALNNLNRGEEALATYRRGLGLARESKNPALVDFMEGNLAGGLVGLKRFDEAIPLLQSVIARKPTPYLAAYRYSQLATSLKGLGRTADALPPANEAVRLFRELNLPSELSKDLMGRSDMLSTLGRYDEALTDARESIAIIDRIRKTLLPIDFLKRGYGEQVNFAYSLVVNLLSHQGRETEALELTEKGRSRAFLDLLAARESSDTSTTRPAAADGLASEAIGSPVGLAGISATAGRLRSTILSYWVTDDAVLIWLVPAVGAPVHVRVPMTREKLAATVAKSTAALRAPADGTGTRGDQTAAGPVEASVAELAALPMRGLGLMAITRDDKSAWRDLYRTLIEPVRSRMPKTGRLTIVPHGPLFQLSFAALQTAAGRYLVEDYEISYAPSISVLEFTSHRQQAANANATAGWEIVGNPASLPSLGNRPLPALPGAAQEINAIAALAPKGRVVRLDGARADETTLRRTLDESHPSVLHFATHGFVFDDPKNPAFLALNRRSAAAAEDGRLTLDEVYGLRLDTDLVVLSACRSGSGQVSSDGVLGLARGFFYAGTPSVLATFWDVNDESTERLMVAFYTSYAKARGKSVSLRDAQLALLKDLRAGKVVITVAGRAVTLPEHPLLWAAFFLSGEP